MSDNCRKISEDFITSLKTGELSGLTKMVKENDNLIICFRDGYINVYYNSHSVFKITEQEKQYKVEFNMGHARYSKDYINRCKGFDFSDKIATIANKKPKIISFYVEKYNTDLDEITSNLEKCCNLYTGFIDDFFNKNLTKDYFEKEDKPDKDALIEKKHQQKLFSEYFPKNENENKEYLFFDLELSIQRNNNKEEHPGSPDCVALKMENGNPVGIVLVEVKSTEAACDGKCGIDAHFHKYNNMLANEHYKNTIKTMAKTIISQYNELGFLNVDVNKIDAIENFSKLFVFTTKETKVWTNNTKSNNKDHRTYKKLSDSEKMFFEWD